MHPPCKRGIRCSIHLEGTTIMKIFSCLSCSSEKKFGSSSYGKYCDNKCQQDYQHKQRISKWLVDGISPGIKVIRRYLKETREYKCEVCGISEWNNVQLTLEVEHKDGNSENDDPSNLCWICPNCHSQTPTYKAKNKGNGRYSRMKRYHSGKSF